MLTEFKVVIADRRYLLKRLQHDSLLTYHIHHMTEKGKLVFRIGKMKTGWVIYPQQLPAYVYKDENELVNAISENEEQA